MRVAFFGGSFDPPHLGHLHIALAACARLRLDRVLLAPVGRQPLKTHEAAPFADRLAMLRLLIAGHAELEASAVDGPLEGMEARPDDTLDCAPDSTPHCAPDSTPNCSPHSTPNCAPDTTVKDVAGTTANHTADTPIKYAAGTTAGTAPNYTVDTLGRLRAELGDGAAVFFLAGADSFLTLPQWHRPEVLLTGRAGPGRSPELLDGWILAARPGFPFEALAGALPAGYGLRRGGASAGPVLSERVVLPDGSAGVPLYLLPDLEDPSTATSIRAAFAEGRAAPHLPASILKYIEERGLYGVR